ncbi:E3 ubiquitin-protein ligase BIG BROTHER isoform X2 [Malania oleifera]|uniref:E3 ubiquitin-protein ligase BIG BROTHER isoform X2 n=1 Tax=Malania oleifera TaxID=397392 RepID=UPI0025AE5480|nr:E3 ubiquitin-protein ligase BIG BROTHER isoform X2 [Malania oleifera]XP_057953568.1 E3 ubiquitin-protein ligase BIG BROTHER isoform X2 [Malania oleifera]XP_057953569.1 E3 ubiquitin-protein ligase BIG BROTHER isoform X2 [Malania oleifera]
MNWNPQMEVHYVNNAVPYSTTGSFMDFFEGLTYEHVNFIFSGTPHAQDSFYPSMHMSLYKYGFSEPWTTSYYDHSDAYLVNDHAASIDEQRGGPLENSSTVTNEQSQQTATVNTQWEGNANTTAHANTVECPRSRHNSHDYQELLELGETVGTQSRGLSQDLIALLPISKYKCGFFSRKKSRDERCVVCQMEYKRGDRQITLPCKHAYHAGCGTRWLSINKACPICYTEVFGDGLKR